MSRKRIVFVVAVIAGLLGLVTTSGTLEAQTEANVSINEVVVNTTGDPDREFVELTAEAGFSLDDFVLLEVESGGEIDTVLDLTGETIPADGFWLAASPEAESVLGVTADYPIANNTFTNDSQTYLLVSGFTGASGDDIDADDDGGIDNAVWSELVDSLAVVDDDDPITYSSSTIGPDGTFLAPGGYRCPDATGDWLMHDFGDIGDYTAGVANACGDDVEPQVVKIHEVQGSGSSVAIEGLVQVEAVVFAEFQEGHEFEGFFIQEEDADVDDSEETSEGIFVYCDECSIDVSVGDAVQVVGEAEEFFGMSQIDVTEFGGEVVILSSGNGLPALTEVTLPATDDDLEQYEGMYVTFPQELVISEFYNYDRFGEIVLTTERQFQPTAVYDPGSAESFELAEENELNRITLDDGRSNQNPDPAIHPNGEEFTLDNRFRGGDIVQNATGALNFSFGRFRIQPTQGADYTPVNERTDEPEDVGGNLTVTAFNVLNYFNTIDDGSDICGPEQDQGCRGADTEEERIRQLDKIVSAMAVMDADVLGIIEVENTTGVEAMADIVEGLNDILGAGTYAYVDTGTVGPDAIKVGFIYKTTTVSLVGDYAVLDTPAFVDPNDLGDPKNRAALAQTFMDSETGGIFTAAVNHFKSKGSPCGEGDDDPQAGSCNLTRTLAAEELVDWLATDPTGSGDEDFLIIGDLNAYDKEDPIDLLKAEGYADLVFDYQGEHAYSYVFDGQLGYLDYGMANAGLVDEVTGTTVWHINADEPDLIDYDTSFKKDAQDALYAPNPYRSSDHDPVLVGLDVCDEIAPTLDVVMTPDLLWPPNHQYINVSPIIDVADNFDTDVTVTLLSVTSNEPDNGLGDGDTENDIVILGDGTVDLRAERSGTGDGRIYTFTYEAVDDCGNSTMATAEVVVPKPAKHVMRGAAAKAMPMGVPEVANNGQKAQ
ncbi:MAG: ExeM/NucH family extracellular endonuclease [Candidatus Promineifilaceae bacterium]|nr:ExeM/NucH family extracellular endonuclease [Candidatus Promineifilaceae bacterium]